MAKGFYDAGALNHNIELQQIIETPDGCGGTVITWQSVAFVWAQLMPLNPRFGEVAQQHDEQLTHRVAIRYRADVMSGWRFMHEGRIFTIKTVHDPDETKTYLHCLTQEEGR